MALDRPIFYNAWFCPFAQRAWIGLLHRKIDFEYNEQDPYNKSGEWLKVNPRGLVPALIHNGKSIFESTIFLEYLDEAFLDVAGPSIMPKDAYLRFTARAWGDFISKKIVPAYYSTLQKRSEEERTEYKQQILSSLKHLFDNMESSGPFYLGQTPGFVDFMLFPHAHRIQEILSFYRGLQIPVKGYEKYHAWYASMLEVPCIKGTLADTQQLIQSYKRYADDVAETEVATAIRTGTAFP